MPKFEDIDLDDVTPPAAEAASSTPDLAAPPPAAPAAPPVDEMAKLKQERDALKARLDMLSTGTRAQQAKLEQLEAKLEGLSRPQEPAGPSFDQVVAAYEQKVAELEAAYDEAADLDPAKARQIQRDIRALDRRYTTYVSEYRASLNRAPDPEETTQKTTAEVKRQLAYEATLQQLVNEYPMLDGNGMNPNVRMIEEVYDIYQPMIAGGADPAKALAKSVKLVAKMLDIPPAAQQKSGLVDAPPPGSAKDRKQSAIDKNLAAAAATPPNLAATGDSNKADTGLLSKYNFGEMSIDEFMRMDDKEQAKIEEALRRWDPLAS